MITVNNTFKDISSVFFTDTNIVSQTSVEAINNSISNILFTNKGEKVGDPEFGTSIRNLLFEPMDVISEYLIKSEIQDAINRYESRIGVDAIRVESDYDSNMYNIVIQYKIKISANSSNQYAVILKRL